MKNFRIQYNTGVVSGSVLTTTCFASSYKQVKCIAAMIARKYNYKVLAISTLQPR